MKLTNRHLPNLHYLLIFHIFLSFCFGDDEATKSRVELFQTGYYYVNDPNYYNAVCRQEAYNFTDANTTAIDGTQGYSLTVYKWEKVVQTYLRPNCSWSKETIKILGDISMITFKSAKGNKNPVIWSEFFVAKIYMYHVILSGNAIQTVESRAFDAICVLQILDLSDNYIASLPVDIFQCMYKLTTLFLSGNRIAALPQGLFDGLRRMRELHLATNLIVDLPKRIFNNNTSLKELELSSNKLQSFRANITHLRELQKLNVSRNCLSGTLSFRVPESLRNMNVSHNALTDIKWSNFRSVNTFLATNNEIESLAFYDISQTEIHWIHLEGNRIQRLIFGSIFTKNPRKLRNVVYLSGNPLSCDCGAFRDSENLRELLSGVLPFRFSSIHFADGLICHSPSELRGREMRLLHPGDFTCEVVESCPENCRCFKIAYPGLITVNCSRTKLKHLPLVVPRNVNILVVDQNDLTSLASLNETRFENLTEVHARGNRISSEEFFIPRTLKLLLLDENRLTTLPETIRSHIERNKDFEITLSGNMWTCECSTLPLKSFLLTHTANVKDAYEIRCLLNDSSSNKFTLLEMRGKDLCPSNTSWLTIGRIVVLIFGVLGIVLTVIYNRLEPQLLVLLYSKYNWLFRWLRCRRMAEERKTFDCFLSYGSEDRDVALAIAHELEDRSLPPLTFCLHERNWKGGAYITDSIFLSVEHCRKTLIVLSRTFVKNKWFRLEFQAALIQSLKDRRDRIILVLKGDVPERNNLPRDVQHYLDTRTYLVWGERWFFEKLKYSLQDDTVPLKEVLQDILRSVANGIRNRRRYVEDV